MAYSPRRRALFFSVCLISCLVLIIAVSTYPVLGNGDSMIYHTSDCYSYNKNMIGNHPLDKVFISEQTAIKAGFRKAKNCP